MTSQPSSSTVQHPQTPVLSVTTPSTGTPGPGRTVATPHSSVPPSTALQPATASSSTPTYSAKSTASTSVHVNAIASSSTLPNGRPHDDPLDREAALRNRKWATIGYGAEEVEVMERTATSLHLAILLDQQSTLFPPPPTAFESFPDVVDRLLPYHVWQIHDEELEGQDKGKGKKREAKELLEAEGLVKRLRGVQDRFGKIRRRADDRPSDLPSVISLVQSQTAVVRDAISTLQQKLRSARAEHDANEAVRRARERFRAEEQARLAKPKPVPPAAPVTPSVVRPAVISTPGTKAPPGSTSASPSSSTIERRKPRGRPRGRGRGGLREAVLNHKPSGRDAPIARDGSPGSTASTVSPAPGTPPALPNSGPTGSTGVAQAPVSITIAMNLIPQFVALGILIIPANAEGPKAPASVVRTTEDKKHVVLSINLSACTQNQLHSLAELLNVKPASGTSTVTPLSEGASEIVKAAEGSTLTSEPS